MANMGSGGKIHLPLRRVAIGRTLHPRHTYAPLQYSARHRYSDPELGVLPRFSRTSRRSGMAAYLRMLRRKSPHLPIPQLSYSNPFGPVLGYPTSPDSPRRTRHPVRADGAPAAPVDSRRARPHELIFISMFPNSKEARNHASRSHCAPGK